MKKIMYGVFLILLCAGCMSTSATLYFGDYAPAECTEEAEYFAGEDFSNPPCEPASIPFGEAIQLYITDSTQSDEGNFHPEAESEVEIQNAAGNVLYSAPIENIYDSGYSQGSVEFTVEHDGYVCKSTILNTDHTPDYAYGDGKTIFSLCTKEGETCRSCYVRTSL